MALPTITRNRHKRDGIQRTSRGPIDKPTARDGVTQESVDTELDIPEGIVLARRANRNIERIKRKLLVATLLEDQFAVADVIVVERKSVDLALDPFAIAGLSHIKRP